MKNETTALEHYKSELEDFILELYLILNKNIVKIIKLKDIMNKDIINI
jgi:hypothetical protein